MKRIPTLAIAAALAATSTAASQDTTQWPEEAFSDVSLENTDTRILVSFDIDPKTFPMKANRELLISPVLTNGTDSICLPPVTIAGRTRYFQHRRERDIKAPALLLRDGDPLRYQAIADREPWMETARLVAYGTTSGCCGAPMGKLPRIELGVPDEPQYIEIEMPPENTLNAGLIYVEPIRKEAVKTRSRSGKAYIDFPVNQVGIYPDYRRNPDELAAIQTTIDKIRSDRDVSITSIAFKGYASPEGPYDNNERLAKGRTEALAGYIRALYAFPDSVMHASWEAEDWGGLTTRLLDLDIPNRDAIYDIIIDTSLSYDEKELRIKNRYPRQYDFLLREIYPALRHSDYLVEFTVRNYADLAEIAAAYADDPSKLSHEELFMYAQSLDTDTPLYREVIMTAAVLFPTDPEANYNAAVACIEEEDYGEALRLLALARDLGMKEASELIERVAAFLNQSGPSGE